MKKFKNIPINYLIILIITVFSVNFIVFLILFISTKVYENKFVDFQRYTENLALTNEKIFKYQDDFFIVKKNTYLEKSDETPKYFETIQTSNLFIDSLIDLKIKNEKVDSYVSEIQKELIDYHKNVQKIIEINAEIYMPDLGLKAKYDLIDQKIYSDKKFQAVNLIQYYDSLKSFSNKMFNNEISKRNYQIEANKIIQQVAYLSDTNTNDIYDFFIDDISDYYNTTIVHFNKSNTIGSNYNEGILASLKLENTIINEDVENLLILVTHLQKVVTIRYIVIVILFFVLFIVLIAFAIYFFYKNIYPVITGIKDFTDNLANGKLANQNNEIFIAEIDFIQNNLNKVSENLKQKKNIINQLSNHNYKIQIEAKQDDEIGHALISLQEVLEKSEKESVQYRETEEHQKWAATGLAKIGTIMRQYSDNINDLAKNILRETLEYVEAVQGIIYVYKKDKNYLQQVAAFSYGKQRLKNSVVMPYEGLIGTILVEKKSYYLENVPEDYLFFETGFGFGKPKSLFAFPLLFENTIYGVFEIASMKQIPDYKRNFLLTLANEIANTISYVEINIRTKQLLNQSNKQADELISNQKLFKKNQENLKSLLRMTEEHLNEREDLLKERERTIKEKVEIILQQDKEIAEKDDVIDNLTTEFENVRSILESRISELNKKIQDLQRRINDQRED